MLTNDWINNWSCLKSSLYNWKSKLRTSKQQFSSNYKVVDNFGNIEECPSTFDSSLPPGGANGCWDKTGSNDQGENICSVPMASECLAMVFFTSKL